MLCLKDFEKFASERLGKAVWEFFANGAERELTLEENMKAFERYHIIPRILRDVAGRDLSVTLLGDRVKLPIGLAPTAHQKLAHPDGELAAAKAAASIGAIYTMSTFSNTSVEEIAQAVPECVRWLQVYVNRDREVTVRLIRRAEEAGFRALALTVDAPVDGLRLRQRKEILTLPPHLQIPNDRRTSDSCRSRDLSSYVGINLTWDDVEWIRKISKLPIIVKGILSGEDAKLAVEHGVSAIWVSNHGGRQLDGTLATIDALEAVVNAVKGTNCEVYMDGGVRWGSDVFKALSLGTRAVFIGRPVIWGLAHSGENGVRQVLKLLENELHLTMTLAGCRDYEDLKNISMVKTGFSKM